MKRFERAEKPIEQWKKEQEEYAARLQATAPDFDKLYLEIETATLQRLKDLKARLTEYKEDEILQEVVRMHTLGFDQSIWSLFYKIGGGEPKHLAFWETLFSWLINCFYDDSRPSLDWGFTTRPETISKKTKKLVRSRKAYRDVSFAWGGDESNISKETCLEILKAVYKVRHDIGSSVDGDPFEYFRTDHEFDDLCKKHLNRRIRRSRANAIRSKKWHQKYNREQRRKRK